MFESLDRRLGEKKSIDDIATELCPEISKGREKIVKIIKMHRGGKFLIDNHEWLGYHIENIRNPTGKTTFKETPKKKSEMLFRPSLSIREPSDDECNEWTEFLIDIEEKLMKLSIQINNTTYGRYVWKIEEIKNRVKKIREFIKIKPALENVDENIDENVEKNIGCSACSDNDNKEVPICKTPTDETIKKKRGRKPKEVTIELHRKIFEMAKEQINLLGRVNSNEIAKEMDTSNSAVQKHLKKMDGDLDDLIKKWQVERDKKMVNTETRTDIE
jgi:hypothetical protein